MKWKLCYIETQNSSWVSEAQEVYLKKINHFVPFEVEKIKSDKSSAKDKVLKIKKEEELFLKKIKTPITLGFDEQGKVLASKEFSKLLVSYLETSQEVTFLIGGAYGLSESIKKKCQDLVSLSSLTMSHQVAQAVALEQIYRALTLWKNLPYHHD